jgi:hypothetical protein
MRPLAANFVCRDEFALLLQQALKTSAAALTRLTFYGAHKPGNVAVRGPFGL